MSSISLVIADDHQLFREGLCALFSTEPRITVVGHGKDGDEAVALAEEHLPDLMLLDLEMPGKGVAETMRSVHQASPHTRILILTMHNSLSLMRDLIGLGASGYLAKSIDIEVLVAALIAHGTVTTEHVSVSIPRRSFDAWVPKAVSTPTLSEREVQILRLVAAAESNATIGSRLTIAECTVKRHLSNIFVKLGAVSRLDAVRKATRLGFLGDAPHD